MKVMIIVVVFTHDCDVRSTTTVVVTGKTGSNGSGSTGGGGSDISGGCLLYTSPSPRDQRGSRMPSSA